ncbi:MULTISPECIES: helix-turn-helix transcriptional regulator [Rhodococcus]|uniref:helix-turn-helix transcriptional regulator n=1 Tax=Rhodococcus TaxID=1827 RepID=UPI001F152D69|nr:MULTISPECIES: helix-turn-helix transcriptional regulator [Rhodococcus]
MPHADLGQFLQTRRARVQPELLGISLVGHRRVPGLRRDEVAMDADISVDYYRRMEQGRERHPFEQILASLARTLRLTLDEQRHLYTLAGVAWKLDGEAVNPPVPQELLMLLQTWQEAGAVVLDPVLDVIALNAHAEDLFSGFAVRRNLLEMVLLDPFGRSFFVDWEASTRSTVANLRASADFGATPGRFRELIEKLRRNSPEFPAFWAMHDVQPKTYETKELLHHERGLLTIDFHAFGVSSAPGHQLLVYRERLQNGS